MDRRGREKSNYFLNLEKHNQSSNIIKELKTKDGKKIDKTNAILGEMQSFYSDLYTSKNISSERIENYLSELVNLPKINNENILALEMFPTYDECTEAVKTLKKEKSPGIDGLPSEFYQTFWEELGPYFYKALNEIFKREELSYSQKLSVISLIHKKNEKDFRPISLTNVDYKIIAFVFAKRLQNILPQLVNKNQTAYIKGRYIGKNARLILDIFEYCENENSDGILLFLDLIKAFDSVEWNFLYKVLQKFNIGNTFIKWIKILYTNPMFKMKNNGWLSKNCEMSRGIRQGCPISALLYLFVAEILAIKINSNNNIKGISINKNEIKSIQHADDLTIALNDEASIKHALDTIHELCEHAG